jgi:hypothetical protein
MNLENIMLNEGKITVTKYNILYDYMYAKCSK